MNEPQALIDVADKKTTQESGITRECYRCVGQQYRWPPTNYSGWPISRVVAVKFRYDGLSVIAITDCVLPGMRSRTLAREVGPDGVTDNVILHGRIATNQIPALDAVRAERENSSVEAVSRESKACVPVGHCGTPEEYDDVVVFLASEAASYVTGSVIRVGGGRIASIWK